MILPVDGDRRVLGLPLLGRAVDALGIPLDGEPAPMGRRRPILRDVPLPQDRRALCEPLWTGIRAIDGLLTFARGMRVGIFGPPGAGKSSLLSAIARGIDADAVVVALIGERGSEARRHVCARDARSTVICAPSDRGADERLACGDVALAHAAVLRAQGLDVAVIIDSLARYAEAARELALCRGELPGRGGYPPSVWPQLAGLCEQAGATHRGSITLVATVLSDAQDPSDPLAEAARALLDGHVVLSRRLAERGAFPAVDVPASLSRPMREVAAPAHLEAARTVTAALGRLEDSRETRELGLPAADPAVARAVAAEAALEGFLRQGDEPEAAETTLSLLGRIADII